TKFEETAAPSPDEAISVDLTGMNGEQQDVAKGMIDEIIPLIKAGKTESEIIKILQERESKKITRYRVEVGDSPFKGPEDAKVTIIEFTDFQCPFCSRVQPTLKKILEKYPQDVRKVFKQHPLTFHKDAPLAAEASLAAGAQGKFWEMKEILFNNQKKLKEENLVEYAQNLGLDIEKFKADLRDHTYKKQVDRESKQAVTLGATGTPAFFVNGRYLSGAKPLDAFVKVIDEELSGKKVPFKWGKNVKDGKKKKQSKKEDPNKIYTVPVGKSPYKGPKDAPITVVMFQDFQCSFSNRSQATIKQLIETYPNQIKLAFKNYPLPFHKDAPLASEAALAAGEQGKFWEMHDLLFENQHEWEDARDAEELFIKYAEELVLDIEQFKTDMDSKEVKNKVRADENSGTVARVQGTPSLFLNGEK
ncbi:MAG: thioredoxin domain-containing protein, partial [Deltaproteobacteria bacterium]|nr:thioredoxin domain-containing protein [Deltaproteobacteria bacterium]